MLDERLDPVRLPIASLVDGLNARRRGLDMALTLGFSQADAAQIAAAISELARNIVFQAGGKGVITMIAQITPPKGIKIVAQDSGPGIADVEGVLAGRCSPPELRKEILALRQIMDEFELYSIVGVGTTVRTAKWLY
jgi:serine/threonine-protein kinase RsbT